MSSSVYDFTFFNMTEYHVQFIDITPHSSETGELDSGTSEMLSWKYDPYERRTLACHASGYVNVDFYHVIQCNLPWGSFIFAVEFSNIKKTKLGFSSYREGGKKAMSAFDDHNYEWRRYHVGRIVTSNTNDDFFVDFRSQPQSAKIVLQAKNERVGRELVPLGGKY